MTFQGALITEQGITFAIVIVKPFVLSSSNREETRDSFSTYFPNIPIILMAQDGKGRPTYHGKKDIAQFLANLDPSRIPWKSYSV